MNSPLEVIPYPTWLLLTLGGLWAIYWDARQSSFRRYFKDARFSRAFGTAYIVLGLGLWIVRLVVM